MDKYRELKLKVVEIILSVNNSSTHKVCTTYTILSRTWNAAENIV